MYNQTNTEVTEIPTLSDLQARVRDVLATLPVYEQLEALESLQKQGEVVGCIPDLMIVVLASWLSCYKAN